MKEHIETIVDSFTDYMGNTHHFVIAAVSQVLPTYSGELEYNPINDEYVPVDYEVEQYVGVYDTRNIASVVKVLKIGISICNPIDTFDKEKGIHEAVARARKSLGGLYSTNHGYINTRMVKALLEQEADNIKDSAEVFINGYAEMRKSYMLKKEMESIKDNFSDTKKEIVDNVQKNPELS